MLSEFKKKHIINNYKTVLILNLKEIYINLGY